MRWSVCILLVLSGCTQSPPAEGPVTSETDDAPVPAAWAVVADGYGIPNFYHESHRRIGWIDHPSTRIPGFPANATALHLTFGADYDANVEADRHVWEDFQPGLYWVPHTNILYLHRSTYDSEGAMPAGGIHASQVAGSVSDACPDCYYLAIRTNDAHVAGGVRIVVNELPWVDVVVQTTSAGIGQGFPAATRDLYVQGRLFFGAAGNSALSIAPRPGGVYLAGDYADPPWIVSVSGSYEQCHAVDMVAAGPAEIVAQFLQRQPGPTGTTERTTAVGTSFSAPTAAGIAAQALFDLRAMHPGVAGNGFLWQGPAMAVGPLQDGNLTHAELRQALQGAAVHLQTTDADIAACPLALTAPAPAPPAPWTKMGHGHVGTGTSLRLVEILLGAEAESPERAEQAWHDAYNAYRVQRFGALPG